MCSLHESPQKAPACGYGMAQDGDGCVRGAVEVEEAVRGAVQVLQGCSLLDGVSAVHTKLFPLETGDAGWRVAVIDRYGYAVCQHCLGGVQGGRLVLSKNLSTIY